MSQALCLLANPRGELPPPRCEKLDLSAGARDLREECPSLVDLLVPKHDRRALAGGGKTVGEHLRLRLGELARLPHDDDRDGIEQRKISLCPQVLVGAATDEAPHRAPLSGDRSPPRLHR